MSVDQFFCFGKKGFCDNHTACESCELSDGEGGIYIEDFNKILVAFFGKGYEVDHLRELVEADRDGRCVVLPVKVGSMVYRVITTRDCPPLLSEIKIKTVEQAASLIGHMGKHLVISYYPTLKAAEAALKGEGDGS